MTTPPRKRLKYSDFMKPAIPVGTVSASRSASNKIKETPADTNAELVDFFDGDDRENEIIRKAMNHNVEGMLKALQHGRFLSWSENRVRDHLFRALKRNYSSISFPNDKKPYRKFTEQDLAAIFAHAEQEMFQDSENKPLKKKEQGLLVTGGSRPDLPTFVKQNGDSELILGELKHNEKYNQASAHSQCLLYLLSYMYWLVTKQGKLAKSVFGFGICGYKCAGLANHEYAVGFFELKAPEFLGQQFRAKVMWRKYKTDDATGLKLLVHLLLTRRMKVVDGAVYENPFPGLFSIPRDLLCRSRNNSENIRVCDGSRAMVFRVGKDSIETLLDNFALGLPRDYAAWKHHRQSISDFLHQEACSIKLFVKVITPDTSYGYNEIKFRDFYRGVEKSKLPDRNVKALKKELLQVYPIEPFVFGKSVFIVMRDRGEPIKENSFEKQTLNDLLLAFQSIKVFSETMCDVFDVVHSDLLPFNIVVRDSSSNESKSLHLIDLDELQNRWNVPMREPDECGQLDLRMYPNVLTGEGKLYNAVQLAFSLISLVSLLPDESWNEAGAEMQGQIKKLEQMLNDFSNTASRNEARKVAGQVEVILDQ